MAKLLKDFFDADVVRGIARDIAAVHPRFDAPTFVASCLNGLSALELTARGRHVAEALARSLPRAFPEAAEILTASLGPKLTATDRFGLAPLRYLPHVFFAATFGLDDFEPAMRLQYELTKRFSAEYSIRAFLVKYPQATCARLLQWARDPNVHVRRLASEGTRPRLPWAPRLPAFQRDPSFVIALLELLKDDPELYVRRSVANNLNDIGKDHPELVVGVCRRWSKDAGRERRWIIRHALRSLVKRGDRGALSVLGFASAPAVRVERAAFSPRRLRRGGTLNFSAELVSTARKKQTLMIDYAVHFVKANGKSSPKVFKLRELVLPPLGRAPLHAKVSFQELTTRRHYPGVHHIELLVNGVPFALGAVRLVD